MTPFTDVRTAAPPAGGTQGLLRWVCTSNPFYVLSAGLFLGGLWVSFGEQVQGEQTGALMCGLAGYTLLLAGTACLLVRFGNVWEDVRTVLLLVVLMFLATSVTIDGVFVNNPDWAPACCVGGLLFAVALSEGLLRGIRLVLPVWFRVPYYLILSLFFLYPLVLYPLRDWREPGPLQWGLFSFAPVAALVFLTLLPAIRRGPDCVRDNGSPWRWPLYPWVLFGLLALAVPARAYLLCWSMDFRNRDGLIIGPYFLVPFGLSLSVLLLEMGLVSGRAGVIRAALAAPASLIVLALVGHRDDLTYQMFLEIFAAQLGSGPLFLTLLALAGFYGYAALRRVPLATEALTAVLVALAFVGPSTLTLAELRAPQPAPLLLAAALQLGLGLWRRRDYYVLISAVALVGVAWLALTGTEMEVFRKPIVFHLMLFAVLGVGAIFNTPLGQLLRIVGAAFVLLACLAAVAVRFDSPDAPPPWAVEGYPLVLAALLAGYGLLLHHRPALAAAALVLTCWLAAAGWQGYCSLRLVVRGLDYLSLSLTLFAVAILVSLIKSGALSQWLAERRGKVSHSTD